MLELVYITKDIPGVFVAVFRLRGWASRVFAGSSRGADYKGILNGSVNSSLGLRLGLGHHHPGMGLETYELNLSDAS